MKPAHTLALLLSLQLTSHAALVTGRVTDSATGHGIEGARVSVEVDPADDDPEFTTRTDPFGFYAFPSADPSTTYHLTAEHPAYTPQTTTAETTADGQARTVRNFALDPLANAFEFFDLFGSVGGVTTGIALENVPVVVERFSDLADNTPDDILRTTTDASGAFSLYGTRAAFFNVRVNHPGDGDANTCWEPFESTALRRIDSHSEITVRLVPRKSDLAVTVTGFNPVTQAVGPLPGFLVTATGTFAEDPVLDPRSTTTGAGGTATLPELPLIDYAITATRYGYEAPGDTARADCDTLDFGAGPVTIQAEFIASTLVVRPTSVYRDPGVPRRP